MAAKEPIFIERINEAGLSDSLWSGIKNSLYKLTGFAIHDQPGIINVAQAMAKNSGTTVTALCRCAVASSQNIRYWFSYTDGKIWQEKAGTYTLVWTTTPAAGGAGCLGAAEYQGYIYWATQSRLHRIAVGSADGAAAWTTNAVEDWATFTNTDASFHPMIEINLVLYIGDANYVAQVDAGTFSANALDLYTPKRIKSLGKYDTDLLIGTYIADTVNKASVFRWNTVDTSFTSEDEIPEVGVNCFLAGDNHVYAQCGINGNIYFYNGRVMELYRTIPGTYSPTAYGEVYPNATATLNKKILFGFSNGSGNPADQGIYQIGRHSYNYPFVMDFPYPISERSGGALVTSGIQIGAILAVGNDLYASWQNSTTFGIDKLNWSAKLELAELQTRVFNTGRYANDVFKKIAIAYYNMPANTTLNISYSKNYGSYVAATEKVDTQKLLVTAEHGIEATVMQVKVVPTVSGNNAPQFESMLIDY